MEEKSTKLIKRARLRDSVLIALYGSTALTLAVLAPNTVQLLKHVDIDFAKKRKAEYRIKEAAERLRARGLLKKTTSGGYALTERGERAAQLLAATDGLRKEKIAWDGKWRVVIFDVWERRKDVRERLRGLLLNVGFVRLQDSVWVYPYPCEELVVLMRSELKLGGGMQYMIVESIENDRWLRRHFGVPS